MNCQICYSMIDKPSPLQCDRYNELFHIQCAKCVNTCNTCGQDIGFVKSNMLSNKSCDLCNKECCKSCGVNITCNICSQTVCEQCYDEDDYTICIHLKIKMIMVKKKEYV